MLALVIAMCWKEGDVRCREKEGDVRCREKEGDVRCREKEVDVRCREEGDEGGAVSLWLNHESPIYHWQHCSKRAENLIICYWYLLHQPGTT